MAGNELLLKAFDQLANSVQQAQIGSAIKDAQKKADEINNDLSLTDFERIRAQQGLAQSAAASVLRFGGDAAQAQQARLSLAPDVPDQAMRALEGTGKATLAEAQATLQEKAEKKEKELIKFKTDEEIRRDNEKASHTLEALGIKAKAAANKTQPMTIKALDAINKPAQQADQWLTVADGVEKFGAKLLTPEALGSTERSILERVKAATEASQRKDIFGATLTPGEEAEFNKIRGSITGSGLSGERYAEGFRALANLQTQVYSRNLKGFAVGNVGSKEALMAHLASNAKLYRHNPAMLKETAAFIKEPTAGNAAFEQSMGISNAQPAAEQDAGFPVIGSEQAPPKKPLSAIPGIRITPKSK